MNQQCTRFILKQEISTAKVRGQMNNSLKHWKLFWRQTVGNTYRSCDVTLTLFEDLPQLNVVSYNIRENILHFDYLPGDDRWTKIHHEQLCLHIRQSTDSLIYHSIERCLPIDNRRVRWTISKDLPYLKLSICSKKHRHICGQEIEMKEGQPVRSKASTNR
jgi:hypothetical protein